jgi:hypothetical protein
VSAHGGFGALPPKLGKEQVYLPAVRDGIPPDLGPEFCDLMPESGEFRSAVCSFHDVKHPSL